MKHYEQPNIRIVVMKQQDVLSSSIGNNPDWQDDFFGGNV